MTLQIRRDGSGWLGATGADDADGFGQGCGVGGVCGGAVFAVGVWGVGLVAGAFAGSQEEIRFEAVLLGVELVVAAVEVVEAGMIAAFDDAAGFDDQNLVGATHGGEAVGDDEGGAAAHQVAQTFLDERFGFGVQAGSGFIENQDARIGEDRGGDGNALALAAGKFYAAFADDGVVALFEMFGEFIDARDAAGVHDFSFGGIGSREGDVLANAAVEKERFLQDDA